MKKTKERIELGLKVTIKGLLVTTAAVVGGMLVNKAIDSLGILDLDNDNDLSQVEGEEYY